MMKEVLRGDLEALGVRAGDLLMVHASLRKLGLGRADVGDGGAEHLLDALDAAVGPEGTLRLVCAISACDARTSITSVNSTISERLRWRAVSVRNASA